jgi:hypothetical protein
MAAAVLAINYLVPLSSIAALALDVVVGAAAFCGTGWGLWIVAGRPVGPEQDAFGYLARRARLRAAPGMHSQA